MTVAALPATQRLSVSPPATRRSGPPLSSHRPQTLSRRRGSRQALVCSRSNTLVAYVPIDKNGCLRPPQPHPRSVRDLQIPIARPQPNRASSSPRFPPYEAFERRPPSGPVPLQRAGIRNPSVNRTLRIAAMEVACESKPCENSTRGSVERIVDYPHGEFLHPAAEPAERAADRLPECESRIVYQYPESLRIGGRPVPRIGAARRRHEFDKYMDGWPTATAGAGTLFRSGALGSFEEMRQLQDSVNAPPITAGTNLSSPFGARLLTAPVVRRSNCGQ